MKLKFLLFTILCILTFTGGAVAQRETITPTYLPSPPQACNSNTKTQTLYVVKNDGFYQCINNVPTKLGTGGGGGGGSSVETVVTDQTGLTQTLSAAAAQPDLKVSVKLNNSITVTSAKVFKPNVTTTFANNSKLIKGNGGSLKFEGVGLTETELKSQTVLFQDFAAGEVQFTGEEYPKEINAEIFDGANVNDRWERASGAFTDKYVKIRINKSGNVTDVITIRRKQTMYGDGAALTYAMTVAANKTALILMEHDSSLIGSSPQSFRFIEPSPASFNQDLSTTFVRTEGMTNHNGRNHQYPTNNVTIRNVGFYGNKDIPGFTDKFGALQIGNGRNLTVDGCVFEGIHGYAVGMGGFGDKNPFPNGTVSTNGAVVTKVTGNDFTSVLVGEKVKINQLDFTVASVQSGTQMTLTAATPANFASVPIETIFHSEDIKMTNNVSRFAVSHPFVGYNIKRGVVSGNHVSDFGKPGISQGAAFDFEPNATDDKIENLDIHSNIIDYQNLQSTVFTGQSGIIVQSATSKHSVKWINIHNNIITGGRFEANQQVAPMMHVSGNTVQADNKLINGIILSGAEYSTISNNIITLSSHGGIAVDTSYKVTIKDNDLYDCGQGSNQAMQLAYMWNTVVRNNTILQDPRRDIGSQEIVERQVYQNAQLAGTVDTRGTSFYIQGGGYYLKSFLIGTSIVINNVAYTIASIQGPTVGTLTTSAGDQDDKNFSYIPMDVIYTGNEAAVRLAPHSVSVITQINRELRTNILTTSNAPGSTELGRHRIQTVADYTSRSTLPMVGDEIVYKAFGTFGGATSTNKRIRLYEETDVSVPMFDSGDINTTNAAWTLEIRVTKTTETATVPVPNTYHYVYTSTFIGGGVTKVESKTRLGNYGSSLSNVLVGSGSNAGDINLTSFKATRLY